jgi:hypothetical protein
VEGVNILSNQRQGHPSWISNCFKKIPHFFRTIVVSVVAWHLVVLRMFRNDDMKANFWLAEIKHFANESNCY